MTRGIWLGLVPHLPFSDGTGVSGSIAFSLSCHIRVSGRSGTLAKLVVASTKVQVVAAEKVSGGGGLFLGSEKLNSIYFVLMYIHTKCTHTWSLSSTREANIHSSNGVSGGVGCSEDKTQYTLLCT